jgi:hypothetical protein
MDDRVHPGNGDPKRVTVAHVALDDLYLVSRQILAAAA